MYFEVGVVAQSLKPSLNAIAAQSKNCQFAVNTTIELKKYNNYIQY